jgi:hypothetical protein
MKLSPYLRCFAWKQLAKLLVTFINISHFISRYSTPSSQIFACFLYFVFTKDYGKYPPVSPYLNA